MRIAILRDDNSESSHKWELACQKQSVVFKPINLLSNKWSTDLSSFNADFCVCRPPGQITLHKKVFDDRLYLIENHLQLKVFPGFSECFIYENKATLADFLMANRIPHPSTFISYSKTEALEYAQNIPLPVVGKTLIGAAGSGVVILKTRKELFSYIEQAFTTGIKRRFGPNPKTGNPAGWALKAIKSPAYFFKKLKEYRLRDQDIQKDVVLLQEYIEHDFEWRCVKIGVSFFAYKKLKVGDKSSGSKVFEYGPPPIELLDFVKTLCDNYGFNFMAVDLFLSECGKFYVNELQTIFGHKNPYICRVNDQAGRYIHKDNKWIFEPGDFNTNESYDLRLKVAIELFKQSHA